MGIEDQTVVQALRVIGVAQFLEISELFVK